MTTLLATLLSTLLGWACAQDPTPVTVTTKTGKTVRLQVLSVANGKAKVKIFAFGGEVTMERDLSVLTPESQFLVETRAANPKTFEQHFVLAKRAAELELLPQAGQQARLAVKAAGDGPDAESSRKLLRAWAADALEKMIGNAVADDDLERAEDCLEILTSRLADQRTEEQLT